MLRTASGGTKVDAGQVEGSAHGNVVSLQELLIGDGLDVGYSTLTY